MRKPHVEVQHEVPAPFAPARSHASFVSTMLLPQIGNGASDQPESGRLSSRILPLNVSGVADAPPALWKPIVAFWPFEFPLCPGCHGSAP